MIYNFALRIACLVVGHAMKFNHGEPICRRCGWRQP